MADLHFADAATAFDNTTRILKIRPEWLSLIVSGTKTLEIRGRRCPHEGSWISLASTRQQEVVCCARMGLCHPLTDAERVANAEAVKATKYPTPWAWPIEALDVLSAPVKIPPWVARGAVQWITRERWEAWDKKQKEEQRCTDAYSEDADADQTSSAKDIKTAKTKSKKRKRVQD